MAAWKAVRLERAEVRLLLAPLASKEDELVWHQAPLETDANLKGFGDRDLRLPLSSTWYSSGGSARKGDCPFDSDLVLLNLFHFDSLN